MDFVHEWQQKLVDKLSIVEELREDRNLVHKGGLMAQTLNTIKKRSTFLNVKKKGQFLRSFSFNIQILKDMSLDNNINVGYTATKRLGNAIKRNKANHSHMLIRRSNSAKRKMRQSDLVDSSEEKRVRRMIAK